MNDGIVGLDRYIEAAKPNKGLRDSIANFFGQGVKNSLEGRTLEDGVIKANWWDKINARSTPELTEEFYRRRADQIRNSKDGGNILAEGGTIDVTKATAAGLRKQNTEIVTRKNLIDEIGGAQYEGDLESLQTKSIPELRAIKSDAVTKQRNKTVQESPEFIAQQEQIQNAEKRALRAEQTAAEQFNVTNRRLDNAERESSRRFLLQEKRLAQQSALNAQTSQLGLQLEYARMAQSDINRREDKREQRLLTLLSGLRGLGEAFLI